MGADAEGHFETIEIELALFGKRNSIAMVLLGAAVHLEWFQNDLESEVRWRHRQGSARWRCRIGITQRDAGIGRPLSYRRGRRLGRTPKRYRYYYHENPWQTHNFLDCNLRSS